MIYPLQLMSSIVTLSLEHGVRIYKEPRLLKHLGDNVGTAACRMPVVDLPYS